MCSQDKASDGKTSEMRSLDEIERLQRDGLVLLGHLAERPGRALVENRAAQSEGLVDPELMIAEPDTILKNPKQFSALVKSVDLLGRAAAPATVASIRLTKAYLYRKVSGAHGAEQAEARRIRNCMHVIQTALLLLAALALYLLLIADEGRRVVRQLEGVRADLDRTYGELWKLRRETDFELGLYVPNRSEPVIQKRTPDAPTILELCWPLEPSSQRAAGTKPAPHPGSDNHAAPSGERRLLPVTPQAQTLCSQLIQQEKRERQVYSRLASWNCHVSQINPLNWILGFGYAPVLPTSDSSRITLGEEAPIPSTAGTTSSRSEPGTAMVAATGAEHAASQIPSRNPCARPPADLIPNFVGDWQRTELRTNESVLGLSGYVLPLLLGAIGGGVFVVRSK